jgi:hypothetical protein
MGKYDLNFIQMIKQVLLVSVRGNLVEFIYVLLKPIRDIHFQFMRAKETTENKLSYNAQYPNFQRLLNDEFDAELRRIQVRDSGGNIEGLLIYPNEERKPLHLGQVLIYPSYMWGYPPFLVTLPDGFQSVENRVRRILDKYKFAGTKYKIVYEQVI